MLHKTLAAEAETITDQGLFRALVSTGAEDREGDIVKPGAFTATIEAWRESGKRLPLAWNHSTKAEDIVGVIDPAQMEETPEGLIVGGKVDLESENGREAWRVMKSGSIGLSIGYLAEDSRPRGEGKGRELLRVDLFEVSLTPTPMNADTRVLSMKSANERDALRTAAREHMLRVLSEPAPVPTTAELKARTKALGVEELARKAKPVRIATFEC